MSRLEALRASFPDDARDIKLNVQAVLEGGSLTSAQRWGVALSSALASRNAELAAAVQEQAAAHPGVVEDARAAAALMAMNNVYYRFRHVVGKAAYESMPARLRMNRLAKPATSRAEFELYCLAVSAINGCEACVRAHEHAVVEGGMSPEQVHDAVRIAATFHAAAVALEAVALLPAEPAAT